MTSSLAPGKHNKFDVLGLFLDKERQILGCKATYHGKLVLSNLGRHGRRTVISHCLLSNIGNKK